MQWKLFVVTEHLNITVKAGLNVTRFLVLKYGVPLNLRCFQIVSAQLFYEFWVVGKSKLENSSPIASMEDTKSCGKLYSRKKFIFNNQFFFGKDSTIQKNFKMRDRECRSISFLWC